MAIGLQAAGREQDSRGPQGPLLLVLLVLIVLAPRLALFPVNENLFGDAVPRTELAERWARDPHVITAFGDGAGQFGPLHLYLVGAALSLIDKEDAGRVVSLLFGVLTVVPLFWLTRRYFDRHAAVMAVLAFAAWGLHMQASTTASSEAIALFLMMSVMALLGRGIDTGAAAPFVAAAIVMNFACALRYDAWMYVPLLALAPLLQWKARASGLKMGLLFGLFSLPFPLWWMAGNQAMHGDAFYPLAYIDDFHRSWAEREGGGWREVWLRMQGMGFWPAIALFTLTPGVALCGIAGMVRAWRDRPGTRWLVVAAAAPVVYFAVRTTLLFNFVPLARFAMVQMALLLPFVGFGFAGIVNRVGAVRGRQFAVGTVVLAVLMPASLGLYTFRADGGARDILRPLSPTSTNSRAVMHAARFLAAETDKVSGRLGLDMDPTYQDLQLGFFARVPSERLVRLRWPNFKVDFARQPPEYMVRFERGALAGEPGVRLEGRLLTVDDERYAELEGFPAPVHVYRRLRPEAVARVP